MLKNLKIIKMMGVVLAGYFLLTACQASTTDNQKDDDMVTTQVTTDHDDKDDHADHDDHDDLIIVSEIMSDGYAYVHGDHDHFEEGKVPSNAKFLDTTLPEDSYKLNDSDVLYEVAEGYIIKVNEKFYYYPKDRENTDTILTKAEAMALTEGDDHDEDHEGHDDHDEDHDDHDNDNK
ncbi:pneumococcal-type histidine triad protein [Streptococcus sp. CSL10205-OR2]|uniref:pneumococcal-type histidine triad protein n=1 Tax=Streptococcus sp. CSL10205-OR2 TaxID=2980558 RepID=UPI0021D97F7D|nr:pneumococcal-type histidine triad protein [Streptococcus sp. CSL10205-OR2]MCU9533920.1 pneumococcal-type histidine triad protein [Streptococcus sp. CSL10205-OR2]